MINMDSFPVVTVSTPEVGSFNITVLDMQEVLWFGNFQTGKLSVYKADIVEGEPLQPCVPVIYVVTQQDIPESNMWGYEVYSEDTSVGAMLEHLLKTIADFHKQTLVAIRHEQQHTLQ